MEILERLCNKQTTPSDEFLIMILIISVPMLLLFTVFEIKNIIKNRRKK